MNSVPRAVPGSLTTLQKLWRVAAVAGDSAIRAARAQWHIFRSHDEGHTMVPHPTFACQVRGVSCLVWANLVLPACTRIGLLKLQ